MAPPAFVALFDILGFKSMVNSLGTEKVHAKMCRAFLPSIGMAASVGFVDAGGRRTPVLDPRGVRFLVFSDTVVFSTADDSLESFTKIVSAASKSMASGFGLGMPVRGAIGYGDLLRDEGPVVLGTAVLDAHELEGRQKWAGCALTEACAARAAEENYIERRRRGLLAAARKDGAPSELGEQAEVICAYEVPVKSGPSPRWAVDWTPWVLSQGLARRAFQNPNCEAAREKMEETLIFEASRRAARR